MEQPGRRGRRRKESETEVRETGEEEEEAAAEYVNTEPEQGSGSQQAVGDQGMLNTLFLSLSLPYIITAALHPVFKVGVTNSWTNDNQKQWCAKLDLA